MTKATDFCRKEWLLAVTLLCGFVLAEVPANVKDYTQTDARYAIENYGNGSPEVAATQAVACEQNC